MNTVRYVVDGHETTSPPPGRRRTHVDIDEQGNATITINTVSGSPPSLPPEVRERVRRMHHDQGMTYVDIARCLNEEGVPTAKGGPWQHSTVAYILKKARRS